MAAKKKKSPPARKSAVQRSQDTLIAGRRAWLDREIAKEYAEANRKARRIGDEGLGALNSVTYTAYTKRPGDIARRASRAKTSPAEMQKYTCRALASGATSVVWVPNDGSTELTFACKKR